ncbi:signal peptidase I [Alkaliphilus crotonatoxidans]
MKLEDASKELVEWVKVIIFSVVIAVLLNIFVLEIYRVQQSSMVPTFYEGDQIFTWKLSGFLGIQPQYGDIVIVDSDVSVVRGLGDDLLDSAIFKRVFGGSNKKMWIKRVIGMPGDQLEFKGSELYLNGERVDEPYLNEPMEEHYETIIVPKDHIFVMGDNRNDSRDSRNVGAIPIRNIRGKVLLRFYPLERLRFF